MDWFLKLIDTLKIFISTRIVFAIFVTSGFLLFLGRYFPFLEDIIDKYNSLFLILFVFSSTLLFADIIILINNTINKSYTIRKWFKRWLLKRNIASMNKLQKAILREFFIQGGELILLPVNNPDVAELIRKGILDSSGSFNKNEPTGIIKYVEIGYEAKELLDPKLIDWPENIDRNKFKLIMKNRPQFLKIIGDDKISDAWNRFY